MNRTSAADGTVVKTGSGELAVASVDSSVTKLSVTDGTLRLATPRVTSSAILTNGVVNEWSLEAFCADLRATGSKYRAYLNTSSHGWTFSQDTGEVGTGFHAGIALDDAGGLMIPDSAPHGDAVIYLNGGAAETDFSVAVAGVYRLEFWVACWGNYINRRVIVSIDGTPVRTVSSLSTTFWKYKVNVPHLNAGTHTIRFEADYDGAARVAYIDAIRIVPVKECAQAPVLATLSNPSFEEPISMYESAVVTSEPTGADWTFAGYAAMGRIQSLNPTERKMPQAMPEGIGTGMVPITGSISQDVTFPTSGVYRLSFAYAAREGLINHSFDVLLDNQLVRSFKTVDTAFQRVELDLPPVSTGEVLELKFLGTGVANQASLIDDVRIERVGDDLALGIVQNGGFEAETNNWICTLYGGAYSNDDDPWGETAPYGEYYGYIAMAHSFAQTITFAESGNYALRFLTKTRNAYSVEQYHDFEVTLGGDVVGYICNMDDAVRSYELPLPFVTAGTPNELKFQGISSANLSLYDEISIIPQQSELRESVAGRFPESMALEVTAGAELILDYDGVINLNTVRYDGDLLEGSISAATHPEFVSGTGSIYIPVSGTLILVN